jgi:hypothetical protein
MRKASFGSTERDGRASHCESSTFFSLLLRSTREWMAGFSSPGGPSAGGGGKGMLEGRGDAAGFSRTCALICDMEACCAALAAMICAELGSCEGCESCAERNNAYVSSLPRLVHCGAPHNEQGKWHWVLQQEQSQPCLMATWTCNLTAKASAYLRLSLPQPPTDVLPEVLHLFVSHWLHDVLLRPVLDALEHLVLVLHCRHHYAERPTQL